MARQLLRHEDYTVGWISALPIELAAARKCLDEEHKSLPSRLGDTNNYILGRIEHHHVVMACLPAGQTGTNSAATVATHMRSSFPGLRFVLMVGVAGGVPSKDNDIRLGDVVVGIPKGGRGGILQYDFGKTRPGGFERTGFLNAPPTVLLSAVSALRERYLVGQGSIESQLLRLQNAPEFSRPKASEDVLFEPSYTHLGTDDCSSCDHSRLVSRPTRLGDQTCIHYGTVASGNQTMRDALQRDTVSAGLGGVLCFEMEAAGLSNTFPCLAIRGICDYADSHKNKHWQPFASATAAAYARELLGLVPPLQSVTHKPERQHYAFVRTISLPFPKNNRFTGRAKELDEAYTRLFVEQDCQSLALYGLGGIGKTQVALALARTVESRQAERSIFWITALSISTIEKSFVDIATLLGLSQASDNNTNGREAVRVALEGPTARPWMIIVDNVDDSDLVPELLDALPHHSSGVVLFTSRNLHAVQELVGNDLIEIESLDLETATTLFERSLVNNKKSDKLANRELVQDLERLPLAITQAAAYINRTKISPSRYLELIRSTDLNRVHMLSAESRDRTRYQGVGNAIATTWLVSFDDIVKQDPLAADLLGFVSCIEWRAIPHSLLAMSDKGEASVTSAVGVLCSYAFLVPRDDGLKYDMHRLVHLAARNWITQIGDAKRVSCNAIVTVAKHLPSNEWGDRDIWRQYTPHLVRLVTYCCDQRPNALTRVYYGMGLFFRVDGRYAESIRWLEACCELLETLDESESFLLTTQQQLARSMSAAGRYSEAIAMGKHVVDVRKQSLSNDDPDVLSAQHGLASTYLDAAMLGEATKLLEAVVEIRSALSESDDARLASEHELARAYFGSRRWEDSIRLYERIIRFEEGAPHNPQTLITQSMLAQAYRDSGRVQIAIRLLQDVAEKYEKMYADDHPGRLSLDRCLADTYLCNGPSKDVPEAIRLLEHVAVVYRDIYPESHSERLYAEKALAAAYLEDGRLEKLLTAVSLGSHVVKVVNEIKDEDDPSRLDALAALADVYRELGNSEKEIPLLEPVVEIQKRTLGGTDSRRLISEHNLARAYIRTSQVQDVELVDQAIALLERVTEVTRDLKVPNFNRHLSLHELARAYIARGYPRDQHWVLKATRVLKARIGNIEKGFDGDFERLTSKHLLAHTYLIRRTGVEDAVRLLKHVAEVFGEALSEENEDLASIKRDLQLAHEVLDDPDLQVVHEMPQGQLPRLVRHNSDTRCAQSYAEDMASTADEDYEIVDIEELSIEAPDREDIAEESNSRNALDAGI